MNVESAKKIIVFGGTFDPLHLAHVTQPNRAMEAVGADLVAYVPVAQSPFKLNAEPSPAHHRLAMLRLAFENQPHAAILTDEIDRQGAGPSYTVDTLRSLAKRLRGGAVMRLLIGTDQLQGFDRWKDHDQIIAMAEPLVMIRPPLTRDAFASILPPGFDSETWAARLIDVPPIAASSSVIRHRLLTGQSVSQFLAPAVEGYIREHQLYGAT